jgi:hypothetical protein
MRVCVRVAEFIGLDLVQIAMCPGLSGEYHGRCRGIGGVEDWIAFGSALHALVNGWQEAAARRILAAIRLHTARNQNDKAGQVFIIRPQTVGCPSPKEGRPERGEPV